MKMYSKTKQKIVCERKKNEQKEEKNRNDTYKINKLNLCSLAVNCHKSNLC